MSRGAPEGRTGGGRAPKWRGRSGQPGALGRAGPARLEVFWATWRTEGSAIEIRDDAMPSSSEDGACSSGTLGYLVMGGFVETGCRVSCLARIAPNAQDNRKQMYLFEARLNLLRKTCIPVEFYSSW